MLKEVFGNFTGVAVLVVLLLPLILGYFYALAQRYRSIRRNDAKNVVNKIIEKIEELKLNKIEWITENELRKMSAMFEKTKRWEKGLKYLEDVDLRYRFGVKRINNEDHKIIYTDMTNGE